MIQSREFALRCAETMKRQLPNLLSGHKNCESKRIKLFRQVDACKSDEARRLILGKSR